MALSAPSGLFGFPASPGRAPRNRDLDLAWKAPCKFSLTVLSPWGSAALARRLLQVSLSLALLGLATSAGGCLAAETAQERLFCRDLHQQQQGRLWNDGLYYRASNGRIVQVAQQGVIARYRVGQLFYYVVGSEQQKDLPGVLNIKFVFRARRPIHRADRVSVYNDRWESYSQAQMARAQSDCAALSVSGYENFHLRKTRNYCLRFHFHQRAPLDTLATPDRRESFAFGDMIPPEPGLVETAWSFIGPRSAFAAPAGPPPETSPPAQVKSWIRNFNFGDADGRCVSITPQFPQGVDSVHLRINNLGSRLTESPYSQDWHLTFSE
jgi:hypothetical protein